MLNKNNINLSSNEKKPIPFKLKEISFSFVCSFSGAVLYIKKYTNIWNFLLHMSIQFEI